MPPSITTSYRYPDGDVVSVYRIKTLDGEIAISDIGETRRWIRTILEIFTEYPSMTLLTDAILLHYGVERDRYDPYLWFARIDISEEDAIDRMAHASSDVAY
jgi:hypothetical protein